MSRKQRKAMIDWDPSQLSLVRQCTLLDISRTSLYYQPTPPRTEDLELMALMDRQYLKTPFYGSRRMKAWLRREGHPVGRKKVRRLMRLMGLEAIYRRPNTSKPTPEHKVYPYLLKGVTINRVNQVWTADITYIPMARGIPEEPDRRGRSHTWFERTPGHTDRPRGACRQGRARSGTRESERIQLRFEKRQPGVCRTIRHRPLRKQLARNQTFTQQHKQCEPIQDNAE